ncbi:DNA recombination protein RmuC, partial [bacterium]|nr:DNA recombination protein RmuC [bacterium]
MPELLLPGLIILLLIIAVILLLKVSRLGGQNLEPRLEALERLLERTERTLREELARGREEAQILG